MKRSNLVSMLAVLALVAGACGGGDDDVAGDAEPRPTVDDDAPGTELPAGGTITVSAQDFAFVGLPTELPAGEVTITMVNEGKEPHMLAMAKLTEDAPPIDELAKLPEKKQNKYIADEDVGFIRTIKPGESVKKPIQAELETGRYAYACFVYSKKNKAPHIALGMYGEFNVS